MDLKPRVLLAMSGGVDSSAAALLLQKQGYEVAGATFLTHEDMGLSPEEAAEGCTAVQDAGEVCRTLGMEHFVLDFRSIFNRKVRYPFLFEYLSGRTPNPCVNCNRYLKFPAFYEEAKKRGYDFISTGHYARVVRENGRVSIHRARDEQKDQSYVLYVLPPELLPHLLLPLGEYTKPEIREMAAEAGLAVANRPDSQDICFIPGKGPGSAADYLAAELQRLGVPGVGAGHFLSPEGTVLGEHAGLWRYTVGQHRHLGISLGVPQYITRIDSVTGNITISPRKEDVFSNCATLSEVNLLHPKETVQEFPAAVKTRYGSPLCEATLRLLPGSRAEVLLKTPARAVTPGQSCVFYAGDELLGGGIFE